MWNFSLLNCFCKQNRIFFLQKSQRNWKLPIGIFQSRQRLRCGHQSKLPRSPNWLTVDFLLSLVLLQVALLHWNRQFLPHSKSVGPCARYMFGLKKDTKNHSSKRQKFLQTWVASDFYSFKIATIFNSPSTMRTIGHRFFISNTRCGPTSIFFSLLFQANLVTREFVSFEICEKENCHPYIIQPK